MGIWRIVLVGRRAGGRRMRCNCHKWLLEWESEGVGQEIERDRKSVYEYRRPLIWLLSTTAYTTFNSCLDAPHLRHGARPTAREHGSTGASTRAQAFSENAQSHHLFRPPSFRRRRPLTSLATASNTRSSTHRLPSTKPNTPQRSGHGSSHTLRRHRRLRTSFVLHVHHRRETSQWRPVNASSDYSWAGLEERETIGLSDTCLA